MSKELFSPGILGQYRIYLIKKNGEIEDYGWSKNEIVANASVIVTRLLGQQPWSIDRISALKANAILDAGEITAVDFDAFNVVRFTRVISAEAFNDTVDEIQLISSVGGLFSRVTGLNIVKDDTISLGIQWKLTTYFCSNLIIPNPEEWVLPEGGDPLDLPQVQLIEGNYYLVKP
jgi:hypothetical protein